MKKIYLTLVGIIFLILSIGLVSAARLPTIDGDSGTWGTILNAYLNVSLNASGELWNDTVTNLQILNNTIEDADISDITNLTLGQKITFTFGQIIDNIVDGWITITGGLNVIGHTNLSGNAYIGNSSMFVNASSGNVGIGTTSPGSRLSVWAGDFNVSNAQNGSLFYVQNSSGNVGIGTVSPGAKLHINSGGSASSVLLLRGADDRNQNEYLLNVSDSDTNSRGSVIISTASGPSLVAIGGNVGFGTDDPAELLEIFGSSQTDGTDPIGIQIHDDTSSAGWTAGAEWASLNFYSDDISGAGPGIVAKISVVTEDTGHAENGFAFYTSGATLSEAMRIASDGNVGIGRTPSATRLDVNTSTANDFAGRFININAADSFGVNIEAGNDANDYPFRVANRSGSEFMRVRGDGNVGIGTVSPDYLLQVEDAAGGVLSNLKGTSAGGDVSFAVWNEGDSNAATTVEIIAYQAGRFGGNIIFGRENAGDWSATSGLADGFISFNPVLNNVDPAGTEAMRITSTGNVGIGEDNPVSPGGVNRFLAITGTSASIVLNDSDASTFEIISAGNKLKFANNNSGNLVTIQQDGDVGIGTASPTALLHIFSSSAADIEFVSTAPEFNLNDSNGVVDERRARLTVNAGLVKIEGLNDADSAVTNVFFAGNLSTGNVGIGTASPDTKLDVNGVVVISPNTDGKQTFRLTTGNADEAKLEMKSVDTETVQISANGDTYFNGGDVGIGTNNPAFALHISTTNPYLRLENSSTGNEANIYFSDSTGLNIDTSSYDYPIRIGPTSVGGIFIDTDGNSGNVGIGTTSPGTTLEIGAGTAVDRFITFVGHTSNEMGLIFEAEDNSNRFSIVVDVDGTANNDKFIIREQANDILTIEGTGDVGIGTASPGAELEVVSAGTSTQTGIFISGYNDQELYTPEIRFLKSHSDTKGTLTTTLTTEILGQLVFTGVDSGSNKDAGAIIKAVQDGAAGATLPTNLIFSTYSSTAANANQLVLHNDGFVGIGTDSPGTTLEIGAGTAVDRFITFVGHTSNEMGLIFEAEDNSNRFSIVVDVDGTANNDKFIIREQANDILTIEGTGEVGIGTTSPGAPLHINYGNTPADPVETLRLEVTGNIAAAGRGPVLTFYAPNASSTSRASASIRGLTKTTAGGFLSLSTESSSRVMTERMLIDSSGNVGIGTASPDAKLHTTDATNRDASLTYNAVAGAIIDNANVQLAMGTASAAPYGFWMQARDSTNATRGFVLQPLGGNVGIGTATPTATLNVVGNVSIDGDLWIIGVNNTDPDYVFEEGYDLMNLQDLEIYIKEYQKLPDSEIQGDFFNAPVTKKQYYLLEKIEEQTLYILDLRGENEMMKEDLCSLGITRWC